MDIDVQPGKYVVAVSGGVDSVVLLHLLTHIPGLQLTVAHFDHGVRHNSAEDRRHVQTLARKYGLPFVYQSGNLGAAASEAQAREARYRFLYDVRSSSQAQAVITAHHQDDVLETAILNLLRGTGRRGLSSLRSTDIVKRPLLHVPKQVLLEHAKKEGLEWREDSTNHDERYLRNYVRRRIVPRMDTAGKQRFLELLKHGADLNDEISGSLATLLHIQPSARNLDRAQFIMLPHVVAREVLAEWLQLRAGTELSAQLLERLVVAAKAGRTGTKVDVDAQYWLYIGLATLELVPKG